MDGEIYALFLCTDRHIFYFQDSVTLCYTWDKKRVSEGVIVDITLGESEENLEIGEEKLVVVLYAGHDCWDNSIFWFCNFLGR